MCAVNPDFLKNWNAGLPVWEAQMAALLHWKPNHGRFYYLANNTLCSILPCEFSRMHRNLVIFTMTRKENMVELNESIELSIRLYLKRTIPRIWQVVFIDVMLVALQCEIFHSAERILLLCFFFFCYEDLSLRYSPCNARGSSARKTSRLWPIEHCTDMTLEKTYILREFLFPNFEILISR